MKRITMVFIIAASLSGCQSADISSLLVGSWQSDHLQVDDKKENIRIECVFDANGKVEVITLSDFAGTVRKVQVYSIEHKDIIRVHADEPNTHDIRLKLHGDELHLSTELYHPGSNSIVKAILRRKET